jgi:hypothetical protein
LRLPWHRILILPTWRRSSSRLRAWTSFCSSRQVDSATRNGRASGRRRAERPPHPAPAVRLAQHRLAQVSYGPAYWSTLHQSRSPPLECWKGPPGADRVAEHPDWPAEGRPRAAHGLRAVEPASATTFAVVNLHGLRDGAGKGDTPARRAQAWRIAEFVRSLRCEGDVAVVAGDFNLLPDSETFDVLAGAGLTDLVQDIDTPHVALRQAGTPCQLPVGVLAGRGASVRGGRGTGGLGPSPVDRRPLIAPACGVPSRLFAYRAGDRSRASTWLTASTAAAPTT